MREALAIRLELGESRVQVILDFLIEWQGTEIDPRFCKISEKFFQLANLKVPIKLSTKTEK